MSSFHLQIVTPDGSFFDGEANSVVVRTTGGYVSIYPHHTDYIAALDIGRVVVTKDGEPRHAACGGGFLSVEKGEVRLVATTFEYADEIDVARAEAAKARAEARIAAATEERDIKLARAKLSRALNRLHIAGKCPQNGLLQNLRCSRPFLHRSVPCSALTFSDLLCKIIMNRICPVIPESV